jgi:hypothetical protein
MSVHTRVKCRDWHVFPIDSVRIWGRMAIAGARVLSSPPRSMRENRKTSFRR